MGSRGSDCYAPARSEKFSLGKNKMLSLGTTGVSGGGRSLVELPFTFLCSGEGCSSMSFGKLKSGAEFYFSTCGLGFCFEKHSSE